MSNIVRLGLEEAKERYGDILQQHLGYTGSVDFKVVGQNLHWIGNIIGCSYDPCLSSRMGEIGKLDEYKAKESSLVSSIASILGEYDDRKKSSDINLCFYLPAHEDYDLNAGGCWNMRKDLDDGYASCKKRLDAEFGALGSIVHRLYYAQQDLDNTRRAIGYIPKLEQEVVESSARLLEYMGIQDPDSTGIIDAVKRKDYTRLMSAIDIAAWLVLKYPNSGLQISGARIYLPDFLAKEEGLEGSRWSVDFEDNRWSTWND